MREWLCDCKLGPDRNFTPVFSSLADNPTLREIHDHLNPEGGLPWNESDAAVIFVTGHGMTSERGLTHWTVLKTTMPGKRLPATALRTADLITWLAATDIQHLFLVLDMCFAGATAAQTAVLDADIPRTWFVLPSASRDAEAVPGALTTAISEFLAELTSPLGRKYAGQEAPFLNVETFLSEVQRRLNTSSDLLTPLPGSQRSGPHLCLPNPCYQGSPRVDLPPALRDMALPQAELIQHWNPRSRGVARAEESGWLFSGREALIRELVKTSIGDPETTLITGCAGSGKSAVLARLVTLSAPDFRAEHHVQIAAIPADLDPGAKAVDVAVVCTGKTPVEIAAQICLAVGIDEPDSSRAVATTEEWITSWHTWLRQRQSAVTLVVDALDEANHPHDVLNQVLARLGVGPSRQWLRLLIGVRSPRREATDVIAEADRVRPLADYAEEVLEARRIRVDELPWWHPKDVAAYAEQLLLTAPGSPYAACPAVAVQASERIAARVGTSFLIARLSASSLTRRARVVDPDDATWLQAVNEGITGVFREDLQATLPRKADRERAVHLLRAVGLAQGKGMPWARIWPSVSACVQADTSRSYGDADIAWLLDSRMGAYLVTDVEDGATVYRLFHDALRQLFRSEWRRLIEPSRDNHADHGVSSENQERAEQRAIARALTGLAAESLAMHTSPPAYARRYAAVHANAGDALDERLLNLHLLAYLDITHILQMRGLHNRLPLPQATLLRALRGAAYYWDFENPTSNAMVLALSLAEVGVPIPEVLSGVEWHPDWANWLPMQAVPLGSASVSTALLPDGRTVAITRMSEANGAVVVDLSSGQTIGAPLGGEQNGAARLRDGRVVVLIKESFYASDSHLVDLASRTTVGPPIKGQVRAVLPHPDGRTLAVVTTGHREKAVTYVWDPETGRPTGVSFAGRVLAVLPLPQGPVAVTIGAADRPSHPQIRSLDNGNLMHTLPIRLDPHSAEQACIATFGHDEAQRFILFHKTADQTRAWNVMTRRQEQYRPAADVLEATATASLPDGTDVAVICDGGWQVIDTIDGRPLDQPLSTLRLRPVVHLTQPHRAHRCDSIGGSGPFLQLTDGRRVAVTDDGRTSFIHDLEHSRPRQGLPVRRWNGAGTGVLKGGRKVMLSPDVSTGLVHVLDFRTGEEIGRPFAHQAREGLYTHAHDAKAAVLPTGQNVVISGGADGAWLWDLDTRLPITRLYANRKHGVGVVETLTTRRGHVLGIVGSQRANVAVYDLSNGKELGHNGWNWPLGSTDDWSVDSIATAHDEEIPIAIISNQPDRASVFDLRTNTPRRELVVERPLKGGCIAAASAHDGKAYALLGTEIWDPSINLVDHSGRLGEIDLDPDQLRALSMTRLDSGEAVAFTLSTDGLVRAHSIPDGRQIGEPFPSMGKAQKLLAEAAPGGGCHLTLYGMYGWAQVTWRPTHARML
ncbi:hypothetical protein [Streptomyces sp. NPDC001530]|uniref:nSTAND1 domain-containing NTPase n=1 Tax=Streptomyces sp. NPDC001530 TaxID=3364582 RepID=UPI00367DCD3D